MTDAALRQCNIFSPIMKGDMRLWSLFLGIWIGTIAHTIVVLRYGVHEDLWINGVVWGGAITSTFTLYMIEWTRLTGRITINKSDKR